MSLPSGVAGDVDLCRQRAAARRQQPHVQVRGAPSVGNRPDRLERIAPLGVGRRRAVALEVVVARRAVVAGMVVPAVRVALPELDHRAGHRAAVAAQHAAGEVEQRSLRRPGAPRDLRQVGVAVGGKRLRIERTLGLGRGRARAPRAVRSRALAATGPARPAPAGQGAAPRRSGDGRCGKGAACSAPGSAARAGIAQVYGDLRREAISGYCPRDDNMH